MQRRAKGTGRVYQRGKTWWIRFTRDGKTCDESSHSPFRDAAERLLRQRLEAPVDRKPTLNDVLDSLVLDYELRGKDVYKMQSHMKPVREKLGGKKAADITEEMVTRYQRERIDHVAKSTVNRECQLIGQALNKIAYPTIISRPIRIRKLAESPAREDFFEPDEVESVIRFLPDYLKDLIRFAWLSGWRKQECTTLTWDCVSFSSKEIRLKPKNSKTREGRILPMTPTLVSIMKQRIEDSIEELPYVFHRRGKFIRDFRKAWYTATKQAGCAGRVFHALRRSSIRDRIRSGVHERVAMSISGHKTRSVFDCYNITNVKDMRDALVKTEKYQDQRRTAGKTVVTFRQGQVTIVHPAEEDPDDV